MKKHIHKIIIGQVILNVNFADKKFMKKHFAWIFYIMMTFFLFAKDLPAVLEGEWDGKDRIISFENPELVMSLKTYYGLYNDRAAEPKEHSEKNPRTRNIATHIEAEHIPFEIDSLIVNGTEVQNAWQIKMIYSSHEKSYVPFVLIDDEIYFQFYVQVNNRCYAQFGSSDGIRLSKIDDKENIACLVFVQNSVLKEDEKNKSMNKGINEIKRDSYDERISEKKDIVVFDVRYWKTKMDYSDESAFFVWNGMEFYVPKHILSGTQNYSCTSGRSHKIRNPMPPVAHEYEDFIFSKDNQVAVKKGTAALKRK